MQAVIEYVIERMNTIDGIDNVYECLPKAQNERDLHSYFTSQDNVQGWVVENPRSAEQLEANIHEYKDILTIDGWYVYNNSTTKQQMQTWVDAIKILFRGDGRLGKTVNGRSSMKMLLFQADFFYDVLCHHVRFEMEVSRIYKAI